MGTRRRWASWVQRPRPAPRAPHSPAASGQRPPCLWRGHGPVRVAPGVGSRPRAASGRRSVLSALSADRKALSHFSDVCAAGSALAALGGTVWCVMPQREAEVPPRALGAARSLSDVVPWSLPIREGLRTPLSGWVDTPQRHSDRVTGRVVSALCGFQTVSLASRELPSRQVRALHGPQPWAGGRGAVQGGPEAPAQILHPGFQRCGSGAGRVLPCLLALATCPAVSACVCV